MSSRFGGDCRAHPEFDEWVVGPVRPFDKLRARQGQGMPLAMTASGEAILSAWRPGFSGRVGLFRGYGVEASVCRQRLYSIAGLTHTLTLSLAGKGD